MAKKISNQCVHSHAEQEDADNPSALGDKTEIPQGTESEPTKNPIPQPEERPLDNEQEEPVQSTPQPDQEGPEPEEAVQSDPEPNNPETEQEQPQDQVGEEDPTEEPVEADQPEQASSDPPVVEDVPVENPDEVPNTPTENPEEISTEAPAVDMSPAKNEDPKIQELENLLDNNLNALLNPGVDTKPVNMSQDEINDYLYGDKAQEIDRFLNDV